MGQVIHPDIHTAAQCLAALWARVEDADFNHTTKISEEHRSKKYVIKGIMFPVVSFSRKRRVFNSGRL